MKIVTSTPSSTWIFEDCEIEDPGEKRKVLTWTVRHADGMTSTYETDRPEVCSHPVFRELGKNPRP